MGKLSRTRGTRARGTAAHKMPAVRAALIASVLAMSAVLLSSCTSSSVEQADTVTEDTETTTSVQPCTPTSSATATTPYAEHGALHVEGTRIVDAHGNAFQVKGVSTHGLAWFPQYVNSQAFTTWRDWGANTVRLALYTQESGGYCTVDSTGKQALLDTLYTGIAAATDAGMYVIVDWHILSDGNPQTNQADAEAFFSAVSARYAGQNNIIYEICNEPNGDTTWDDIRTYAEDVIPLIRANCPDAVISVGTPTWSQDVDKVVDSPLEDANVVYTLHFYAGTHKQNIRNKAQTALDAGLPLLVTEFGACDASGNGALDIDSANEWMSFLTENDIGYVCWNLSNKDEASALLASTSTAIGNFTEADLSEQGLWYKAVLSGDKDAASANSSGSGGSSNSGSSTGLSSAGSVSSEGDGTLQATVAKVNSWESDGKQYVQYSLTVKNSGSSAVNGWNATVGFESGIELSQGWCADYAVEGGTLNITPASYLTSITAGQSDGSIGFIVSGQQTPVVQSISTSS